MPKWNKGRRAGIILHPTSLPGAYGIGELGPDCFAFLDWLESAGMQMWQVLPLVPPDPKYYSPYSGLDADCGNPLLISIDALITEGLLDAADAPPAVPAGDVDFEAVAAVKNPLLAKAAQRLLTSPKFAGLRQLFEAYRKDNAWIEDSAMFDVLRQQPDLEGLDWWEWPEPLRFRQPAALAEVQKKYKQQIDEFVAIQFLFDRQWQAVKVGGAPAGEGGEALGAGSWHGKRHAAGHARVLRSGHRMCWTQHASHAAATAVIASAPWCPLRHSTTLSPGVPAGAAACRCMPTARASRSWATCPSTWAASPQMCGPTPRCLN
jgi:hypothetical protein